MASSYRSGRMKGLIPGLIHKLLQIIFTYNFYKVYSTRAPGITRRASARHGKIVGLMLGHGRPRCSA